MTEKRYDLVVIGSGPGGYVAAIRAAQLGMATAIVERDRLGGVCLNWGCIPSKALLSSARVYNTIRSAAKWGISTGEVSFDIEKIIGRSREVADNISKGVAFLMKKNRIEVLSGTARLEEKRKVVIDGAGGDTYAVSARHAIVATGGRARTLQGVEVDGVKVLTSRQALETTRVPKSIVIIGGGAIGCEFAYFYNSFGSRVTVVEMLDHLLPLEDEEVSLELERSFKKQGIRFLVGHRVEGIDTQGEGVKVTVTKNGGEKTPLEGDTVLLAVGVRGNVEGLGLEELGIVVEKGRVEVDRWYQTAAEGVYAIGDVIGPPWLAHVASHEGVACVERIAGLASHPLDYRTIPACTYCQPQVASVGLTEKQAVEQGFRVKTGKFPFRVLGKARAAMAEEGFVKLVFEERYGELLGAHIIGEEATELIAELVTAKALETTYLELLKTVHAHPTLSEAIMEAAGAAYGEQIHL